MIATHSYAQCVSQNQLDLAGSTEICPGGGRAFISVIGDFEEYSWDNGSVDSLLIVAEPGIYNLIVTDSLGCTLDTSIEIVDGPNLGLIVASPDLEMPVEGPFIICNIDSTLLHAGYNFQEYLWSTGETTPNIYISESDTYELTVTDFGGCTGTASLEIKVQTDSIAPTILTCPGSNGPIEIQNSGLEACDGSSQLIENSTGFSFQSQWTGLDGNVAFPGVATDNLNQTEPALFEYRDSIIISECNNSNVAFEFERTWRASDICGNFDSCSQIIRIIDSSGPIIIDGVNFFLNQDSGNPNGPFNFTSLYCPVFINWQEPNINDIFDNCTSNSNIQISSSNPSGTIFQEGITAVSYLLEDECGNQTEYIFEVDLACLGCDESGTNYTNCNEPPVICNLNELDDYTGCTPAYGGQVLGPLCNGGALNNPSYLSFIAASSGVSISITPEFCSPGENGSIGLQANITDPCNPTICYASSGADCFVTPFTIQANNLIIGQEYQLIIDGCNGSACQWSININNAPSFDILNVGSFEVDNYQFPNCYSPSNNYCSGSELIFFPDNHFDSEFYFCWSINNNTGVTATNQSTNCLATPNTVFNCGGDYNTCGPLKLVFDNPGTYTVCLDEIENGCDNQTLSNYCQTVIISSPANVNFGSYNICQSNMPWQPNVLGPNGESWLGNGTITPGLNSISTQDVCGCTNEQTIFINVISEGMQSQFIDICADDLTSFFDPQYGVSWSDLQSNYNSELNTASISLANGSNQTQFDGTSCSIDLNYQFFLYDLDGSILQTEGQDCNSTLTFNLDLNSFPTFMFENNLKYSWTNPSGVEIGTDRSVDVDLNGTFGLRIEYIIPTGSSCFYNFNFTVNESSAVLSTYYIDIDGDGFGNANNSLVDCEQPFGYVLNNTDCNDAEPTIHPGAPEIPNNGIDENCDGTDTVTAIDNDQDGYTDDVDCNDNDPVINPNAAEIPNNNVDENCDGVILIIDLDGDGFNSDEDCDDSNVNINPSVQEIPNNNTDENCDGIILEIDADGDGFNSDEDCDDTNAAINPGVTEIPNNSIDENCDGIFAIVDMDNDGWNSDSDCNDFDASINPTAIEIPNNDVDENCDGIIQTIDNDNDGFNSDEDCDDNNAGINPNAEEIPNNAFDENCDGTILVIDIDGDGFNSDVDCDDSNASINPAAEEIPNNDFDENCDGEILVVDADGDGYNSDEDCDDFNGSINPGVDEIPNNDIDENCDGVLSIEDLDNDGYDTNNDCDDNDPSINPDAEEIPNNDIDENCDGSILIIDIDGDGFNSAEDCNDDDPNINPDAEEIPNNDIDENCDGLITTVDMDEDGYDSNEDCDDSDASINPDAEEIPNNDIDENCDGSILIIDIDGDGFNSSVDCDDNDANINPDAEEILDNEFDEDCDGIANISSATTNLNGVSIKIYPNPFSDFVTIKTDKKIHYQILSIDSQIVSEGDINSSEVEINCNHLSSGVYFIILSELDGKEKSVSKLIKIQ